MLHKWTLISFCLLLLTSCNENHTDSKTSDTPDVTGFWRAVLQSPGGELPFGIEFFTEANQLQAVILNGPERADTSAVVIENNSIRIEMEWYDARIEAQLSSDGQSLSGEWSKTAPGQISRLPFTASKGYEYRFPPSALNESINVDGNWEVTFTDEDGSFSAVAEFSQEGDKVTGTFLTSTGDYRYLDGRVDGDQMRLSTFDGAHAFLFDAQLHDKELQGNFWSRDTYHATWKATRTESTEELLPDSWSMNQITAEENTVSFAFEDAHGELIQLSDDRFNNKAVIVNLFGTWCPNCNDEAPVLAEFYRQYHEQDLEIVGLAFEFTEDKERDQKQILAFKKRHNIEYPLLLAGGYDKAEATKILGFLDEVKAYPTSIFLDRKHQVVAIHTGFAGPGTGEHYTKLVDELEKMIQHILSL